jgi:PAS domain S-box
MGNKMRFRRWVQTLFKPSDFEVQLKSLNKLYATLSQINQTIIRVKDDETFFQEICNASVTSGQFCMAWIGILQEDQRIVPVAQAGKGTDYLEGINIDISDRERRQGPTGRAIIEGHCTFCQDIATDALMRPWRDEALKHGFCASASVPIRLHSKIIGAYTVYADEPMSFGEDQLRLVEEIGANISFTLEMLEIEKGKKITEEQLLQSQHTYQKIFEDHAAVKLLIDPQTSQLVDANKAAAAYYGWPQEQLKTMHVSQINVNSPEQIDTEIKKAIKENKVFFEFKHRLANGDIRDVEVYSSRIEVNGKEYLHSIVHDITDRKMAELQLKEKTDEIEAQNEEYIQINEEYKQINEDLFNAKEKIQRSEKALKRQNAIFTKLLKNLTQGVFMVEAPSGKPIMANDSALQLLGRGILPGADKHNLSEVYKAFKGDTDIPYPIEEMPVTLGMKGETTYIDDMVVERPDGSRITLEVFGTPITDETGQVWASLVSFTDITHRKKTEQELIKAKERAEESDRLKTAFIQNMSHEIRTPMNAIMGFSELLNEVFDKKDKLEMYSQIINHRCRDLLDIINDLLDISRIESGQMKVSYGKCDLDLLFADLSEFFNEYRKRLCKEYLEFELSCFCDFKVPFFSTDVGKLKQILINLITNALKFTEHGKITGGCKWYDTQTLLFYVKDTGTGIPADKQEKVFDRFIQLNESRNSTIGGTGLGLPIVKGLVNLLGGEVFLESEPGKGSTFSFTIPYRPIEVPHSHETQTDESVNTGFSNQNVLIVEDDHFNAMYLQEILTQTGLMPHLATTGKEAMEKALNLPVDLILMDVRLPDTSGYEITRQLKQHNPELKIIAQTAYASPGEIQKAMDAGCNDYISKPINKELLIKMMNKHLTQCV